MLFKKFTQPIQTESENVCYESSVYLTYSLFLGILQYYHLYLHQYDWNNDALSQWTGKETSFFGDTTVHRGTFNYSARKSKTGKI